MRIGYPCINYSIERKGTSTFRLKSYSPQRLIETVEFNLVYLRQMLEYNLAHEIYFFRISSGLVPFASHPVCKFNWQGHFAESFAEIGKFIKKHKMRINMHPDQFVLINSIDEDVLKRSVAELEYHAQVLELLGLGAAAKIQLHVGGVYGSRDESMARFARRFEKLSDAVRKRLVIENDHVNYGLSDCMEVHRMCGAVILFDVFHHSVLSRGETIEECFKEFTGTWKKADGKPMVDYSSQKSGARAGTHTESIDVKDFKRFLDVTSRWDFDIMLEIKDKEASAAKAIKAARGDKRLFVESL
ncbi:MAG: UV damage repair endonuclease UvsE [Planctomycetes bacterium GWF2_50_10]|nr:MAG: UV damage repair endonuclease UvsE [Planctomycetes bacterium GWF2_50_10]